MVGKRTLSFWLTGYTLFMIIVGTNLPSPLYEVYRQMWGFSPGVLTFIFAVYALTIIPTLLIFGQLSDRIGRRQIILIGLITAVIGSIVFAAARGIVWLSVARIIQGLGVGILSSAATAALVELHPEGNREFASLVASGATTGGTAVGPLLAGILAQYGPAPLMLPYLIHLGLLIPGFFGVLIMPETVQHQSGRLWRLQRPKVPASIWFRFMVGAIIGFTAWMVAALFVSLVPSYITLLLGTSNLVVTGGSVFLMFGASTVAQIALKQLSVRRSMRLGTVLLVVGLGSLVGAVPVQSLVLVLFSSIVTGLGHGLAFMGAFALINDIAPDENRGDVVSMFYAATYMGFGVPILGVGFGANVIGLYQAVLVFAGFAGLLALCMAGLVHLKIDKEGDIINTALYI